jgi:hypothetical protein
MATLLCFPPSSATATATAMSCGGPNCHQLLRNDGDMSCVLLFTHKRLFKPNGHVLHVLNSGPPTLLYIDRGLLGLLPHKLTFSLSSPRSLSLSSC